MSSGVPQAYHILSSASVDAFLTAQGMFLMLRHLERALIKFLRLVASHVLQCNGNPTVEIFTNLRAGKLPLLLRFGYKYPFKSIFPNYLCIQELLRTYVESANFSHSLMSFQKPIRGHFPHSCKFFKTFQIFFTFLSLCLSSFAFFPDSLQLF